MKNRTNVVIIDDDHDFSESLVQMLEVEGHLVSSYSDPDAACKAITPAYDGVVLLDVRMPRHSGEDILQRLHSMDAALPVILMTGHGDIPMAVRALKVGAYGFFAKPLQLDEFHNDIRRAQGTRAVEMERRKLARQLEMRDDLVQLVVGTSPLMVAVRQAILKIGSANTDVLIEGETGTGKKLVARALMKISARSSAQFVVVNCGILDADSCINELFGIEKLDDAGKKEIKLGRFELANGGTLLLDEVDSLTLDVQQRLLRFLQDRSIERVNTVNEITLDIRVLATTKADLSNLVKEGKIRQDLYYLLTGSTISMPPLRERGADPVILFERNVRARLPAESTYAVSTDLMAELLSHDWPGNVRELANAAERYAAGLSVFSHDNNNARSNSLSARVANFEKGLIEASLTQNQGSIKRTMLDLDVPRKTLHDKMSKYDIQRTDYLAG
ncbi:MAG: sigma-54 dependent transcriptional regulator [Granulosicoccaceae bacterium]